MRGKKRDLFAQIRKKVYLKADAVLDTGLEQNSAG